MRGTLWNGMTDAEIAVSSRVGAVSSRVGAVSSPGLPGCVPGLVAILLMFPIFLLLLLLRRHFGSAVVVCGCPSDPHNSTFHWNVCESRLSRECVALVFVDLLAARGGLVDGPARGGSADLDKGLVAAFDQESGGTCCRMAPATAGGTGPAGAAASGPGTDSGGPTFAERFLPGKDEKCKALKSLVGWTLLVENLRRGLIQEKKWPRGAAGMD